MIFYVLPLRGVRESRDFSRVEVSRTVFVEKTEYLRYDKHTHKNT